MLASRGPGGQHYRGEGSWGFTPTVYRLWQLAQQARRKTIYALEQIIIFLRKNALASESHPENKQCLFGRLTFQLSNSTVKYIYFPAFIKIIRVKWDFEFWLLHVNMRRSKITNKMGKIHIANKVAFLKCSLCLSCLFYLNIKVSRTTQVWWLFKAWGHFSDVMKKKNTSQGLMMLWSLCVENHHMTSGRGVEEAGHLCSATEGWALGTFLPGCHFRAALACNMAGLSTQICSWSPSECTYLTTLPVFVCLVCHKDTTDKQFSGLKRSINSSIYLMGDLRRNQKNKIKKSLKIGRA